MIKLIGNLPKSIFAAVSGGVDSMAALDFLRRAHDVTVLYFDHGTETGVNAYPVVAEYCVEHKLPVIFGRISGNKKPTGDSLEEFWRKERYTFFHSFDATVVTAHHLDDCVETYIWGCLHGTPKVIPHRNKNVVRPFLTTTKEEMLAWATRKNVKWYEDKSNSNTRFTRNYIRHELMPHALTVNPGLRKTVKKIVERQIS